MQLSFVIRDIVSHYRMTIMILHHIPNNKALVTDELQSINGIALRSWKTSCGKINQAYTKRETSY